MIIEKLKVLSLFSGIGAFETALTNKGYEFDLIGFSEIDNHAIESYSAIHKVNKNLNLGSVADVDGSLLPQIDLLTHGSPCQDFSVSGKQGGGDEGSKTRSSLMWETVRIISETRPKYVIWENVKNVLSKRHKHNFDRYIEKLEELGYKSYHKVLNAKEYGGLPQNRDRVFVVSVLSDNSIFNFPEPTPLQTKLVDYLEEDVDEKFFLSEEYMERYIASTKTDKFPFGISYKVTGSTVGEGKGTNSRHWVYDINSNMSTLDATMYKQPKQIAVPIRNATKKGYIEARSGDGIDLAYPNSNTRRGRVQKEAVPTLQTGDSVGVLDNFRLRKLTPLECWRLMGFSDEAFHKAAEFNSNTQLYKQAGNSIVVPILEAIFDNLIGDNYKNSEIKDSKELVLA